MRPTSRAYRSAFALTVAVSLCSASPGLAATPFVNETVYSAGITGFYTSLALDAHNNPHISFFDETDDDLFFASRSGATWTVETVDAAGTVGLYSSLELDRQDNPHISYLDDTNRDLKYATKNNGAWTFETVESAGDVGHRNSLALDPLGNPRIVYNDYTRLAVKYASKSNGLWTIELVDSTGELGNYCSLAIDAQGRPHIAYQNENDDLIYASKRFTSWVFETVEAAGVVGNWASIALDSQNNPRIAYADLTNGVLKYASRSSGDWVVETVDFSGDQISLALDVEGNPKVSYHSGLSNSLKFASKSGGAWTTEIVDATWSAGAYTSIALDTQGNPCISYMSGGGSTYDLNYADSAVHLLSPLGGERWAAGSEQMVRWSGTGAADLQISEDFGLSYATIASGVASNTVVFTVPQLTTEQATLRVRRASPLSTSDSPGLFSIAAGLVSPWWTRSVAPVGQMGWRPSLALDARGTPHIGYLDVTDINTGAANLKYARRNGMAWDVETVAPSYVGDDVSLALDPQGNPRIGYRNGPPSFGIGYASKVTGVWSLEVVDAPGNFFSTSLALDVNGSPRISYYDNFNGDLEYASSDGGVWVLETVDATGNVGRDASLALDAQGNPRISYYDDSNDDLKLASRNNGVWTLETVDATGNVGKYTSLALDAHGNPRISYQDAASFDLKYASKNAGGWTLETVDAAGFVGYQTSLALDRQGNPHISYIDASGSTAILKYARKSGGVWTLETIEAGPANINASSLRLDAHGVPHISYAENTSLNVEYASAAIELGLPAPGDVWPVGSSRTVRWDGTGFVDLYLSMDGGNSWNLQTTGLSGGEYRLQVPHTPSRFAKYKLERAVPHSIAVSDLFSIETSISLLSFAAALSPEGGAELSWATSVAPEDLGGYRIERGDGSRWSTIASLVRTNSYTDRSGSPGDRYRLFAINGLGEELMLGETSLLAARALAAWPLPYRSGALNVSFGVTGGIGGGPGHAEVGLYDLAGRKVRTLERGIFETGYRATRWDGRDDQGAPVSAGMYFLRASTGGETTQIKVVVTR